MIAACPISWSTRLERKAYHGNPGLLIQAGQGRPVVDLAQAVSQRVVAGPRWNVWMLDLVREDHREQTLSSGLGLITRSADKPEVRELN